MQLSLLKLAIKLAIHERDQRLEKRATDGFQAITLTLNSGATFSFSNLQ